MKWLAPGALEPGHILGVLHALQEFFIVLDGDDYGDGFAVARHDFGFSQCRFHVAGLSGSASEGKGL